MAAPKLVGLRIDIETRSRVELRKSGVYPYVECPDFKILVVCYAPLRQVAPGKVAMGKVRKLDLTSTEKTLRFRALLQDPKIEKHAFNAPFERIALSEFMKRPPMVSIPPGLYLDPENWRCSSVLASTNGVFGSLDEVARAVRSPIQKDAEGKRLIRLFSVPDKKSGEFHDPHSESCWCGSDHRYDFGKFEDYCATDVLTEAAVAAQFPRIEDSVQAEYEMDQRINDRGFRHFGTLSRRAVEQVEVEKDRLMQDLRDLTGVENPNSPAQMKTWLSAEGYPMLSLDKEARADAVSDPLCPPVVKTALTLKEGASLSSVAKHQAALNTRCKDGRIRGSLQFYGAHTGREAGRGIQPQNLPRYEAPASDRLLLLRGLAGPDAPRIAKGTVRASIVPAKGHRLVILDYNAIEARVLGWEAGETWVMDEFTTGPGKIYEATASTMFGVDKDDLIRALDPAFGGCDKCGDDSCDACRLRGRGKVSNLAFGYGGGPGALVAMGAEKEGIDCGNFIPLMKEFKAGQADGSIPKGARFHEWQPERHDYPELQDLKHKFRDASPATVRFWKLCEAAWDNAARRGQETRFGPDNSIVMRREGKHNRLILPSGRSIWYRFARSHEDDKNPDRVDRRTFIGKGTGVGHMRTDTHGGKLTENITQAIARDALFETLMKIQTKAKTDWPGRVVLHVHDEVVLEVPEDRAQEVFDDVSAMMSESPSWGPTLPLKGAGSIESRYKK